METTTDQKALSAELRQKAEDKFPYEFMIEKSLVDSKRHGYLMALIETHDILVKMEKKVSMLTESLKTIKLCSNFEELKKEFKNTEDHWTNEIDEVLAYLEK